MARSYTPPQATETTPRPPITLSRVKSSQVAAIGYDPETRTLAMQFASRAKADSGMGGPVEAAVYHYPDVSPETHAALLGVGVEGHSIGVAFGSLIKPLAFKKYPAEALPAADA